MITEIKINNFKSVADLTLPFGRVNVLIGSNGSGKSNILEAIAFGAAASADKLDNEFLGSRGIRTASAQLMKNAFSTNNITLPIKLNFKSRERELLFTIQEDNSKLLIDWIVQFDSNAMNIMDNILSRFTINEEEFDKVHLSSFKDAEDWNHFKAFVKRDFNKNNNFIKGLPDYIIYSPEISSLRKFEEESQIKPLGIKGEGLFSVLQIFYESYGTETIDEIRKYLNIIEWFGDFEAIFDKVSGRSSLVVKDRNLPDVTLNQHNVNEGFLFLLFYISLMISNETPSFFAIDNIEASFHPILCEELIKVLVELAKKHNKQVILTTHNPFILDGLDLNDDEQKLFVVERNGDGETIANQVKPLKKGKLSEAWLRGRIGGNPQTI